MIDKAELKLQKQAALKWANKVRARKGLKSLRYLPKGRKQRVTQCPLAIATGENILGESKKALHPPSLVDAFIYDFDQGNYPELVKK